MVYGQTLGEKAKAGGPRAYYLGVLRVGQRGPAGLREAPCGIMCPAERPMCPSLGEAFHPGRASGAGCER